MSTETASSTTESATSATSSTSASSSAYSSDSSASVDQSSFIDMSSSSQLRSRGSGSSSSEAPTKEEGKPLRFLRGYAQSPKKAYTIACGSFCSIFLIVVILVIALGTAFFEFSTDVPLYLRDNVYRERDDAIIRGQDLASTSFNAAKQLERIGSVTRDGIRLELEVIYESRSGDIFDIEALQEIRKIEDRVFSHPDYNKWCRLDWSKADFNAATAATDAGDTAAFDVINNKASSVACEQPRSALTSCIPGAGQTDCSSPAAAPAGLLDCNIVGGCTRSQQTLTAAFKNTKIAQLAVRPAVDETTGNRDPIITQFLQYPDSKFGNGEVVSRTLRTVFRMGFPLAGYANSDDRLEEQIEKIAQFIFDAFAKDLIDSQSPHFRLVIGGTEMDSSFMSANLISDLSWAIGSLAFVMVYMAIMQRSWFLSIMGLGQILLSFAPAYLIYYLIFQQRYFGQFNMLTIFIILGIGADDIFVITDAWSQSAYTEPFISSTVWTRLSWAWKRSAKAMLVTSLTTMVSFLANAFSSFPAISSFGIFAASLVLSNYLAVIFFYPACITLYNSTLAKSAFCCGFSQMVRRCWKSSSTELEAHHDRHHDHWLVRSHGKGPKFSRVMAEDSHRVYPAPQPKASAEASSAAAASSSSASSSSSSSSANDDGGSTLTDTESILESGNAIAGVEEGAKIQNEDEEMGATEAWFHNTYFPFLYRFRYVAIFVSVVIYVVFIVFMVQIGPDPETITLLPKSHPIGGFQQVKRTHYSRGGGDFSVEVTTAFGFDTPPIDRSGTDKTKTEDRGKPRYDSSFSLPHSARCMDQICTAMQTRDDSLQLGGLPEFPVTCWIHDFKSYVIAQHGIDGWNARTGPSADTNAFYQTIQVWVEQPGKAEQWIDYIFVSGSDTANPVLLFTTAEVKTSLPINVDFETGMNMADRWEDWMKKQLASGECAAHTTPAFQTTRGAWHWFFLQDQMAREAFQGIAISLSLAFVVLTVATGNILVAFIASLSIMLIVLMVMGFAVMMGYKLGILESIIFVLVPGMAVDFVAHFAEAYASCHHTDRISRTRTMLTEVGVSVISGAVSTMGASIFLFFPLITFYPKFGQFIFATIAFSLYTALVFFSAVMMTPLGPEGTFGVIPLGKWWAKIRGKKDT